MAWALQLILSGVFSLPTKSLTPCPVSVCLFVSAALTSMRLLNQLNEIQKTFYGDLIQSQGKFIRNRMTFGWWCVSWPSAVKKGFRVHVPLAKSTTRTPGSISVHGSSLWGWVWKASLGPSSPTPLLKQGHSGHGPWAQDNIHGFWLFLSNLFQCSYLQLNISYYLAGSSSLAVYAHFLFSWQWAPLQGDLALSYLHLLMMDRAAEVTRKVCSRSSMQWCHLNFATLR